MVGEIYPMTTWLLLYHVLEEFVGIRCREASISKLESKHHPRFPRPELKRYPPYLAEHRFGILRLSVKQPGICTSTPVILERAAYFDTYDYVFVLFHRETIVSMNIDPRPASDRFLCPL